MDDEPATEILEATYRALCTNGYANLTMQDIASESDVSKASIHYHYDSKENLFATFLDFLYERYTDGLDSVTGTTFRERLLSLLDTLLVNDDGSPGIEFRTAMLEVRAQAPYDDTIRTKVAEFDTALFERLRDIIAAGIEAGEFDERVDPVLAAEFLTTTIKGAHTRQVAVDRSLDRLYEAVVKYVDVYLTDDRVPEVTS